MGTPQRQNIRNLTANDIPFGMRLKAQNHWNQLEGDWRRQLDLEPDGGFVAERDGEPIGTACCCVFDDIAWISLVLVDQHHRGQGVGTLLMRHVVRYLDGRGVASIRLDATPLGQPVYEKLGFVGDFALTRFEGVLPVEQTESPAEAESRGGVKPMTSADLPAVGALDEAVTQTRRARLLRHLYESAPDAMRTFARAGKLEGYCMARPGANAWHIGPVQGSLAAGRALMLDASRRFAGQRVYLDVPTEQLDAVALVRTLGLTPQRTFLRMTRGQRVQEDLARHWCSFGPEKG